MLKEKDYCDYDTCVALKKLGYKENTLAYYTSEGFFHWRRAYIYDVAIPDLAKSSNKELYKHVLDAVSLYEAQKWMREKHNLHIEITYSPSCWTGKIYDLKEWKYIKGFTFFESFEDALHTLIKEAVKILKEKQYDNI